MQRKRYVTYITVKVDDKVRKRCEKDGCQKDFRSNKTENAGGQHLTITSDYMHIDFYTGISNLFLEHLGKHKKSVGFLIQHRVNKKRKRCVFFCDCFSPCPRETSYARGTSQDR